jgi:hypothetical protein
VAVQIQLRHGTAAAWTAANPLLAIGETGVETDTNKFKFGDGVTLWNALPYAVGSAVAVGAPSQFIPLDGKPGRDSMIPGPQGPAGAAGSAGAAGAVGAAGPPGLDGKQGPMGFPIPGPQGPQGAAGSAGSAGPQGIPGPPGLDARPAKEPLIIPGPRGLQGLQGDRGAPGLDGRTIQPLMIPGPIGPAGPQGPQGNPGAGGGGGGPTMLMALDGKPGPPGFLLPIVPPGARISELPLAGAFADADEFPVNQGGTTKKSTGLLVRDYIGDSRGNQSVADQAIGASVTAYITNSNIAVPTAKLRIGTWFRYRLWINKTAAGTVALILLVKLGTLGTTGDTTLFTLTLGVGTAAVDSGWFDLWIVCRGPLSAAGIFQLEGAFDHSLATTGLNNVQRQLFELTSAAFDVTTAGLILGLAITTGASYALTSKMSLGEAKNL